MDQWVEEMERLEALVVEQWHDIDRCPGHQDLDLLNARFRHTCTQRRTRDYTKNWICPSCRKLYMPSQNLLGDLPPFGCSSCNVEVTKYHICMCNGLQCLLNSQLIGSNAEYGLL